MAAFYGLQGQPFNFLISLPLYKCGKNIPNNGLSGNSLTSQNSTCESF
jgi:hypothetical protein